jgi:co-chaperonin GroES (HSP10)
MAAGEAVLSLEERFSGLAQKIYAEGTRKILPTYPWVLIRVIPKEQKLGGIYLPDNAGSAQQNKPLYEGIVLVTWKPFVDKLKPVKEGGAEYYRERKSEFVPGDRILYPSFAGLPVNFLDETKYRLVREWTYDPSGGVMCKVDYQGDAKLKAALDELFGDVWSVTLSGR